MTRTKEVVALANWGYQYTLLLHSPMPEIPVFLQHFCFGSKNAEHDVLAAPLRILLETADIRKKSRMLWSHLCVLLQFWTDKASYLEGNVFYGGLCRETSNLVQYIIMRLNNETVVTWRDVVRVTPWLDVWVEFSAEQQAAFYLQPAPSEPSELKKAMEAWWQVRMMQKKCAAPPAAPPNTPATDTEESGSLSTGLGPSTSSRPKPPPGIPVLPSNQFVPTSDWTKLPNRQTDMPATSTKYQTPFDELDEELDRSSVVEMPLMRFGMEDAVDSLLRQCPDLTSGSSLQQASGRHPGAGLLTQMVRARDRQDICITSWRWKATVEQMCLRLP